MNNICNKPNCSKPIRAKGKCNNHYYSDWQKQRTTKRRNEAVIQLGGLCRGCGSTDNLEFDHIDFRTKNGKSRHMFTGSLLHTETELKKCQLLCHDCHQIKTNAERKYYPHMGRPRTTPVHGSASTYCNQKCRCQPCKDAWSAYKREYKRKRALSYN